MSGAIIAALFFTVALLVTTAYFIMGSIPLLVLRHLWRPSRSTSCSSWPSCGASSPPAADDALVDQAFGTGSGAYLSPTCSRNGWVS